MGICMTIMAICDYILPRIVKEFFERRNEKKRINKMFTMEVENLKKWVQKNIDRIYKKYKLRENGNEEIDLAYSLINYSPTMLGIQYDLNLYHENRKNLIYLEDDKRKKISSIFDRVSTINSILDFYNNSASENNDKSIVKNIKKSIHEYFKELKNIREDLESF